MKNLSPKTKARLLVIGVVLLSFGIYWIMSPYQQCMRNDITRMVSEIKDDPLVFRKDLCREMAKDTRWDWFKEMRDEPSGPIRP